MTNPEPREVLMVRSAAGEGHWSPIDPAVGRAGTERGQSWLRHQEGERHPVSGVTGAVMPRLAGERASHHNLDRYAPVEPQNAATPPNGRLQTHRAIVNALTERQ